MKAKFILITIILFLNQAIASANKHSLMRIATISCYQEDSNGAEEHTLVIYEPWPINCREEFKPHAAILSLSTNLKVQKPAVPLALFIGKVRRTIQGGFEYSLINQNKTQYLKLEDESSTTKSELGMGDNFGRCTIAKFKAICQ